MALASLVGRRSTQEAQAKKQIFIREVCDRHCKLCKSKNPDFCMMFLAEMEGDYFQNILIPLKLAREYRPRLFNALRSFEGFVSIFCNKDCPLPTSNCDVKQKIDCFQMFLTQSLATIKDYEIDEFLLTYSEEKVNEFRSEFIDINRMVKSKVLSNKQRKRIAKIQSIVISLLNKCHIGNNNNNKNKVKQASTLLFYNDNDQWIEKIKQILEGDP